MKIAIIGAGSSYTPEILEGLVQKKDHLPVTHLSLKALLALLAHPLVGEYETALPLLDEMLEANRLYLPQFFPEQDKIE
jgi:alpha-galactosidase/6-phospho-beta-glucosidase family protein